MAKFTKEAVSEKIRNILKTTGGGQEISDRTINDTLENLMIFANEEVELDAFVAQIQGGLISMNGNMRREVKEKLEAIPKPAPTTTPIPEPIPAPAPSPEKSALEIQMEKFIQKMEAQELKEIEYQKKVANDLKLASARKLLETSGAANKKVLEVALSKVQITEDMTDEQISAAVLPLYNTEYKDFYGDGQSPITPIGQATPEAQKGLRENANKLIDKALGKVGVPTK